MKGSSESATLNDELVMQGSTLKILRVFSTQVFYMGLLIFFFCPNNIFCDPRNVIFIHKKFKQNFIPM